VEWGTGGPGYEVEGVVNVVVFVVVANEVGSEFDDKDWGVEGRRTLEDDGDAGVNEVFWREGLLRAGVAPGIAIPPR
jgi:hypothetical protein